MYSNEQKNKGINEKLKNQVNKLNRNKEININYICECCLISSGRIVCCFSRTEFIDFCACDFAFDIPRPLRAFLSNSSSIKNP